MSGFIYVLGNDAMPGILKIGRTSRAPAERARELSVSSGVPLPFEVLMAARFEDEVAAERECHQAMASVRVSRAREFFRSELLEAYGQLTMMTAEIEITAAGEAKLAHEADEVDRSFTEWIERNRGNPDAAAFIEAWEGA